MKIYVGSIFLNKFNSDNLYKIETTENHIYSTEGIYYINNNTIVKKIPLDKPIEKFSFKNYNFIIDYSDYIFRKNIYNINYNHIINIIDKTEYKFNEKSRISMIIEKEKSVVRDLYFETKEKVLYIELKEDIIKYLSLFKEY